jgi:integrase
MKMGNPWSYRPKKGRKAAGSEGERAQDGLPYVFVPTARYDYINNVLRPKGEWTLTDSRLKVVNNFRQQFNRIRRRAGVKQGTFHDFRRTAISMWFANGMGEHDVMVLARHADRRACVKNWCILVQVPFELEKVLTAYEGSCYLATS